MNDERKLKQFIVVLNVFQFGSSKRELLAMGNSPNQVATMGSYSSLPHHSMIAWLLIPHSIEMALSILKGLLRGYVQSLFDEGIVNDQFSQIHTLKSEEEPEHVLQLIDTYFVDVEITLSELTSYIDCPDVDFSKLAELAHKVEERSSCIGAAHVRLACGDLIQACDQMNKENFSRALIWIKNEFSHTRSKLEAYVQMEQRIIRLKSKQQACVPSSSLSCVSEVPKK